ncbi:MAG: sulfurtransferase TusA family protein [Peptostreptococcaceae bacterium]|nr:sulfurtransferase TusA family protein [Peptostreptococcaceae bacterium]
MNKIDTRGMSCPQPVLMTKKAIEQNPKGLDILVGDKTAKNNIKRFLESKVFSVAIEENDDEFLLKARK